MWSILPILLLFVLGFLLQKSTMFTEASLAGIKKVVSTLALPALLFQAFSSLEIEKRYLLLVVAMFLVCLFMVLLGKALAKPLKLVSPYFPLLMGGFEMGMLGYALFLSVYGSENLGKMALVDLGQVLFVFFVLMALLIRERDGITSPKVLLRQFLTSPVIVAIFAGIVVSLIGKAIPPSPFWTAIGESIALLANLTVPLIAISIGYGIHIKRAGLALSVKTILFRKIVLFVLALAINYFIVDGLLNMDSIYRYAVLVMFLTPPPFVITIYMRQGDKANADYVDNTLSLDTLFSILLVMIATSLYV
ncbi:putative permease [Sphaerochaeta pleomorpha str. Grapes]|uniref:Putative permease n=1 Tax=Sphaerochaeta pleomorpha (strain ATCC BAA-1885 / DSM 22778 / Grapes) TaxID=158190 RepID=G8QT58_SPHPG|nr:AEC family transporter [Sphaerochaeta pleomorpha]AEV27963.1 putative permease [Sphaerochaeta pleomorpha str. Grapes]